MKKLSILALFLFSLSSFAINITINGDIELGYGLSHKGMTQMNACIMNGEQYPTSCTSAKNILRTNALSIYLKLHPQKNDSYCEVETFIDETLNKSDKSYLDKGDSYRLKISPYSNNKTSHHLISSKRNIQIRCITTTSTTSKTLLKEVFGELISID
jgi:hypothetical protein